MSVHKLSAGDGYTYLTRQVATVDSTERGYSSLGDYYAAKGESPGLWIGTQAAQMGLAGTAVTEQQMKNLFGQGLHPDAEQRQTEVLADLPSTGNQRDRRRVVDAAGRLGSRFPVFAASPAWHENLAAAYQKHNLDQGLPKGDKVPEREKQTIRTQVGTAMFTADYGRAPHHDHELNGFITRVSRPSSSAVAGFDLTFSPVKSVSTLWAIAPREVSEKIEAAHQAAVAGTLAWLESEAGYTREGAGSVCQIRIKGFLATAFTHRDSRAGDPDLHTHVAVSNKVQTPDGRWLALDARMLYRYNVPASEQYNLLLEAEITQRVGGVFAARGDAGEGKREIRELVGVPDALNEHFSSRMVMINGRRAELIVKFRADHGRVPTTVERIQLSQQANLATRQAKHEPTSLAQQRVLWQAYPEQVCPESPAEILADVLGHTPDYADITPDLVADLATRVVQVVSGNRAQWRENNLSAEARRQAKAAGVHPAQIADLATTVTAAATGADFCVPIGMDTEIDQPLPGALKDVDGKAVFRMAKGQLYTSGQILDAETRIVAAAGQSDAWALSDADVDIAHLEFSANHDVRTLNTGQEAMVRQVATSGRRVQLVFGPAGTGKTTSLAVLSLAAQSCGMTVVGLAPQASAAQELAAAIPGITSDTLHKLLWHLQPEQLDAGHTDLSPDPELAAEEAEKPPWISDIGPRHLVIIDEAGLAGTRELDVAIGHITGRGGRVLLVGDDRQRAAGGAGGVLRDIESAHGAVTLDEVMRFQDRGVPGGGALHGRATLAVRHGDPGSAGYYVDRYLLNAVTPDTACAEVFAGWSADIAAGADSIMIAPTLDMVADLNSRARAARLTAAGNELGPERDLNRGEKVSAGDLIVTKKNKRVLSLGGTDFVRNNYRWTVDQVNADGSITATEMTRGLTRTLPAWYVDKGWVRLGYAHTEASVQGMTVGGRDRVGTAHAVFTDRTNRNQLYTNLSRATDRTQLYGILPGSGDTHDVTTQAAVNPATVVELFTAVLSRDGSDRSATTTLRESADPVCRLGAPGHAAGAYAHSIDAGCVDLVGEPEMTRLTAMAQVLVPGVTTAPSWETLRGHLAAIAADGGDPVMRLTRAVGPGTRPLTSAADVAAVLDHRLDPTGNHSLGQGPLPWLPKIPAHLATQPLWDNYLSARETLVSDLAQQIRDRAFGWTVDDAPAWAIPYLPEMDLVADLAVWRAAHTVPETDLRPAGPRPLQLTSRTWHQKFVDQAVAVAGDPTHGADRWAQQLTTHHHLPGITADDYFPVLAARLSLAEHTGIDVPTLLRQVITTGPLPVEAMATALWWRLEPHLGSITTQRRLPASGHRLRPGWTTQLQETLGQIDAQRVMSDPLWPTIVTHIDRAVRDGHPATLILPAAGGMFSAARPTLAAHELATVLLWQISTVTDPAPPDPDVEAIYPDPERDDLLVPAGAYDIPDDATSLASAGAGAGRKITTVVPPQLDPAAGDLDPFDADTYAAAAALVDAAYADLDLSEPTEPGEDDAEPPSGEVPPADLYAAAPDPVREWVNPEPPAAVTPVHPEVAPVVLPKAEQQAALSRARAAIAAAQAFWAEQTPTSWVPAYITGRGLDPADFLYAPAGWTATMNHLTRRGFTEDELKAAGLITRSARGSYIDVFQDRAVTGIHHPDTGDVVAFTGRKNPDDRNERAPKYVNSPTTDLFHKSALPFGLTSANLAAVRDGADLAVVEGPMDALAVNHAFAGDHSVVAVAASGVVFTADHIATINRAAPNPHRRWLLVLDDDQAGHTAAVKIFPRLLAAGITHPETISDLTGKDPAQMLHTQGTQALRDAFDARRPLAELVIDTLIAKTDLTNGWVESRWRAMSDVAPFIANLPRDQIIDQSVRAAEIIGWDTHRAIDQVARYIPDTPQQRPHRPTLPGDLGLPELPRLSTGTRPQPPTAPTVGGTLDAGTVLTRPDIVADEDPHSLWDQASDEPTDLVPGLDVVEISLGRAVDLDDLPTEPAVTVAGADPRLELVAEVAADLYAATAEPGESGEQSFTLGRLEAAIMVASVRNDAVEPESHRDAPSAAEQNDAAESFDVWFERVEGATRAAGEHLELPDTVLFEQRSQAAAALAEMQRIREVLRAEMAEVDQADAAGGGSHSARLKATVEHLRQQWEDVEKVQSADRDFERAAEAITNNALTRTDLNHELAGLGAFSGHRKAQLAERLNELDADDAARRQQVVDARDRIDPKVRAAVRTAEQQQRIRNAVAAVREQLPELEVEALERDTQERSNAQARLARAASREQQAQVRLDAIAAEQQYRLENPDPVAEQGRRKLYSIQQAELADRAEVCVIDQDWAPPPVSPDQGMER